MSEHDSQPDLPQLPLEMEQQIDRICDEFEQAARSGQQPQIDSYLDRMPEVFRADLLRELIASEAEFRRASGKQPQIEEFVARFPGDQSAVRAAFQLVPWPDGEATTLELADRRANVDTGPEAKEDATPGHRIPKSFGDYRIIAVIARGGMGVVYKAEQTRLHRLVALKVIRPDRAIAQQLVDRFHSEAEVAANLDHPNIVPVFDVGQHQGQHYLAMAYIDGGSLADVIRENPLSGESAARYCQKIASAIQYAHRMGILHRDLKPSNVLIDQHDEPRVTDFGLAKRLEADRDLTLTGEILGTPNYMPPEQAKGEKHKIDERSDIYSLGALLYSLITGRPPFQARELAVTLVQVIEKDAPSPRTLNPAVDPALETICLKCLEKDPSHRYSSMQEVADELGKYLKGDPIAARPVAKLTRVARRLSRNPALGLLSLFVVMTVALGAGLLGSIMSQGESGTLQAAAFQRFALTDLLFLFACAGPVFSLSKLLGIERTRQFELSLLSFARRIGHAIIPSAIVTLLVLMLFFDLVLIKLVGQADTVYAPIAVLVLALHVIPAQTYLGWSRLRKITIWMSAVNLVWAFFIAAVATRFPQGELPLVGTPIAGLLCIIAVFLAGFVLSLAWGCIGGHTLLHASDRLAYSALQRLATLFRSVVGWVPWPISLGEATYHFNVWRSALGPLVILFLLLPTCLLAMFAVSVAFCFLAPLRLTEKVRQLVTPETPIFSDLAAYLVSIAALVTLFVLRFSLSR